MPLDPALRRALTDRVRYYNDLGIYDFYSRPVTTEISDHVAPTPLPAALEEIAFVVEEESLPHPKSQSTTADPATALRLIREDIGDCTRCRLHNQGRKQIVFGVVNPNADLMFIGDSPGEDDDEHGVPVVGCS